jgi:membrane protease YdiL (CAAX protease family)
MTEETSPSTIPGPMGAPAPVTQLPVWGPRVTTGLLFVILGGVLLVQLVIGVFWVFAVAFHRPDGNLLEMTEMLQYDGDLLAVTTIAGAMAAVALVALLVRFRGATIREYLGLKPVHLKTALLWIVGTLAFLVAFDLLSRALHRPTVPDFMIQAYTSATLLPLLWIAIVGAAPLWEEIVFRGFAFPGLRSARFGLATAILVPGLLWTALHSLQYDAFDLGYVLCLGVLFGFARERTGSVLMPIILHVLTNILATIQVALR